MRPFLSRILTAVLLLAAATLPAFPEDIPIRIKADDLNYDQPSGIITATGSVKVSFKDIELRSNTARIDLNANIATLEGAVEISKEGYSGLATAITYDISKESSIVFDVSSVFRTPEIKGNLYVSSQRMNDYPDHRSGEEARATTCDYTEPHYFLKSRYFDYYPNDRLVGYSNTMYEGVIGEVPLLWTPIYVFNLKKRRAPNNFVYGVNQVEGRFLKTAFDYYINKDNDGILYLDFMEKKGFGWGARHEYVMDAANSGILYFYLVNEADTGLKDYAFRLSHSLQLDQNTKISFAHRSADIYNVPSGRIQDSGSGLTYNFSDGAKSLNFGYGFSDNIYTLRHTESMNANYREGAMSAGYTYDESRSLGGLKPELITERYYQDQPFIFPNSKISFNLNYYKNSTAEGTVADEKMEPRVSIDYAGSFYSINLNENLYMDLDEGGYQGDSNYEYRENLPELNISFNPMSYGGWSLGMKTVFGRYHEAKYVTSPVFLRHMTANKYFVGGDIRRSDPIGMGTTLSQSYGLDQNLYDTGDARYQLREGLGLETHLGGFFQNNIDYSRGFSEGNTPFFFDNLGSRYSSISEKIRLYYGSIVNFTTSGGYNYQTKQYFDIISRLDLVPNEQFSMNVSGGYSIENKLYRDLVASAVYRPFPRFTTTGGLVYNLNSGKMTAANSSLDLEIGENWQSSWHIIMSNNYDFFADRFVITELTVKKDLHCWETQYTYSDYRKEHRIGVTLKAFPDMPIGFVGNDRGYYFENLNIPMPQLGGESPRRY